MFLCSYTSVWCHFLRTPSRGWSWQKSFHLLLSLHSFFHSSLCNSVGITTFSYIFHFALPTTFILNCTSTSFPPSIATYNPRYFKIFYFLKQLTFKLQSSSSSYTLHFYCPLSHSLQAAVGFGCTLQIIQGDTKG